MPYVYAEVEGIIVKTFNPAFPVQQKHDTNVAPGLSLVRVNAGVGNSAVHLFLNYHKVKYLTITLCTCYVATQHDWFKARYVGNMS